MSISEQDKIGREEVVDKICGLVDSLEKDKNFCLALNGAWGSGKSFVLSMIEEELLQKSEYIVIKYDAWKNNFYSDPLIAILYCILDTLRSDPKYIEFKYKRAIKKVLKQFSEKKFAETLQKSFPKVAVNNQWGCFLGLAVEIIKSVIKEAKSSILDNDLFNDYKSYQTLLRETIIVLNVLTSKQKETDKQIKIILLVDEIDRCLPDEQLKILERVHHLFEVNNCAVIVALNREQVTNTYSKICGGNGKEYLRKFFDYNFELLMLNGEFFKNALWDNIILNSKIQFISEISKQELEFLQRFVFQLMEAHFGSQSAIDNRTLKKMIKHILHVVDNMPEKKMDFTYLVFIAYLVACRMYDGSEFQRLKNKDTLILPIDVFNNCKFASDLINVVDGIKLGNIEEYNFYRSKSVNSVNFYLSMWVSSNDELRTGNIEWAFDGKISIDSDYMKKLEIIFNKVNYIAD